MRVSHLVSAGIVAGMLHLPQANAADPAPLPNAVHVGKLDADLALQITAGTQMTGAADWSVGRESHAIVLTAPERDVRLAVIELEAPSGAAAIEAGWQHFSPGSKRVPTVLQRGAGRNGWDERLVASYDIPPNEKIVADAFAVRSGSTWTVVLLEGATATAQKRSAAVELMQGSLRPNGFHPESFAGRSARPLDAARIARLRSFVEEGARKLRIPGAAMALIENGKIVYEGGIGVRDIGRAAPVDVNTMFMAASNTKGMSTLLLASLADEGKLRWDQPVTELYPAFKLGDADVTSKVLFKHLVCACTGLPRQDLEMMFEYGKTDALSSIKLLANMKPTSKFGELYQYSNVMASTAGYIGGALAHPDMEMGAAYDKAMQERIFDPLGMRHTTFDMDKALRGNHASPHTVDIDNRLRVGVLGMDRSIMPHRPAGGVWTSVHDFARYVQLEANEGRLDDGRQLISRANLLERRKPQVQGGDGLTYGMGLEILTIADVTIINHGGSVPGYKSNFFLLPDAHVGAVLMTNSDYGMVLMEHFQRYLLEELYEGKPEAAEDLQLASENAKIDIASNRARLTLPPAPAVVSALARHYRSSELGDLAVRRKGKHTYFDIGEWQTEVASIKNADGSASLLAITPGIAQFEFVVARDGGKRTLVIRDGQHEYSFIETQ